MIHAGSRNLGHKVAGYHNNIACKLNEAWHVQIPKEWQLAFLPIISNEAKEYTAEMNYCVEFALAKLRNRVNRGCDRATNYQVWVL